jgi:hypothetical protein
VKRKGAALDPQAKRTLDQNALLQAACEDLSRGMTWHGHRLSKADWRHLISATVLGQLIVPGIDVGKGPPGLIQLGASSTQLRVKDAGEAIQLAYSIGDQPHEYDPTQPKGKSVAWGAIVSLARGFRKYENEIAEQSA